MGVCAALLTPLVSHHIVAVNSAPVALPPAAVLCVFAGQQYLITVAARAQTDSGSHLHFWPLTCSVPCVVKKPETRSSDLPPAATTVCFFFFLWSEAVFSNKPLLAS